MSKIVLVPVSLRCSLAWWVLFSKVCAFQVLVRLPFDFGLTVSTTFDSSYIWPHYRDISIEDLWKWTPPFNGAPTERRKFPPLTNGRTLSSVTERETLCSQILTVPHEYRIVIKSSGSYAESSHLSQEKNFELGIEEIWRWKSRFKIWNSTLPFL